jgi:hypothetical protein
MMNSDGQGNVSRDADTGEPKKSPQNIEKILARYPTTDGQVVMTYGEFDELLKTPRHQTALRQAGRTKLRVVSPDPNISLSFNITLCIKKESIPEAWRGTAKTFHDTLDGSILETSLDMSGKFILASKDGKIIGYGDTHAEKTGHTLPKHKIHRQRDLEANFRAFVLNPESLIPKVAEYKDRGVPLFYDYVDASGQRLQHRVGTLVLPQHAGDRNLVTRYYSDVAKPYLNTKIVDFNLNKSLRPVTDVAELTQIFDGAAEGILLRRTNRTAPFMVLLPE